MTVTPQRIQKMRAKDWVKPANCIVVDRRSEWKNPFTAKVKRGEDGQATMTRQMFVDEYRFWLTYPVHMHWDGSGEWVESTYGGSPSIQGVPLAGRPSLEQIRSKLRGKDLACDCDKSQPCHAEVLLEIANSI